MACHRKHIGIECRRNNVLFDCWCEVVSSEFWALIWLGFLIGQHCPTYLAWICFKQLRHSARERLTLSRCRVTWAHKWIQLNQPGKPTLWDAKCSSFPLSIERLCYWYKCFWLWNKSDTQWKDVSLTKAVKNQNTVTPFFVLAANPKHSTVFF